MDEGAAGVVPLTVREAPQGATWGAEVLQLPGLELLQASLERRLPDPPVTKLTGLRLSEVGLGMASAIRCAMAVREHLGRIGLDVRAGVHAGECEEVGGQLVGIAVHIGSRLVGIARPGEVLVSSTVRDLVAGSGIGFDDRGEHTLRGIAGQWHLYTARAA